MPRSRLTLSFAPPFAAALLAAALLGGCQEPRQQSAGGLQQAAQAQQAVQQQYDAEAVSATVRRQDGQSLLEVVLVNPGGREATNQQRALAVGGVARRAYGESLDTVRVSFEYSSRNGPAETGFHRRYNFAPSELDEAPTAQQP